MNQDIARLDPQAISKLHEVFASASLDMAGHALEGLGVPAERANDLREATRRALATLWSGTSTPEREAEMVGAVLDALEDLLGHHDANEVKANLIDAFFDTANDAQMFLWEQVVAHGDEDDAPARLPVLLKRLRSSTTVEALHRHADRIPGSDYDRALFARYGYATDPTEEDLNPMPQLDLAAARVAFLRGLRKATLAAEDPEAEVDELLRWGKVACETIGIPSEMLERPAFLGKPVWPPA